MSNQQYPSLKSWAVAGGVFVFLFGLIHLLALHFNDEILKKKQRIEATHLLKHVTQQMGQETKKTKVVVLGSSLIGQGVSCSEELDTAFHHISLSKIFLNTHLGVLETFMDVNVFDSLLLHPPDILLIEVDQLAYHIEQDQTVPEFLSTGALFLKNLKTTAAFGIANYRMPEYCGKIIQENIIDSSLTTNVNWHVLSFHDHPEVKPYLKKLRAAGVKILLIQIPRPGATDRILHSGEKEKELLKVVELYKHNYQMSYWNYPDYLPFSYFYDKGHLNKKGRLLYSKWLYAKLEKEIQ